MSAKRATVAFIGLGQMGRPMSGHLAQAGYPLRLYDVSAPSLDAAAADTGGLRCDSAADCARGADVVITMLPDGPAVQDAVLGPGGVIEGAARDTVVIDMSSSHPVGTRTLGETLTARGLRLIDAPVSGGVVRARRAELAVMVGGDAQVLERVRDLLGCFGKRIFHAGPLGAGHAVKALNNYVSAAGLIATCEALVVARRFGIDPETMTDVLNASSGRTNTSEAKVKQFMLNGRFDAGFSIALMVKDIGTAASLSDAMGVEAPFAHQCESIWRQMLATFGPAAEHTEMYRFVSERVGKPD